MPDDSSESDAATESVEGTVVSSGPPSGSFDEEHDVFDVSEDVSASSVSAPIQSSEQPASEMDEGVPYRVPWQESVPDEMFVPWYKSTFFALTMILLAIVLVVAWVVSRGA